MHGPRLDYYNGRAVKKADAVDGLMVSISLDGGVIIGNEDPDAGAISDEMAKKLVGTVLLRSIFSAAETRLQFGYSYPDRGPETVGEVVLTPSEYTISDPSFQIEEPWYPQRSAQPDPADDLPEDPSPERFVDEETMAARIKEREDAARAAQEAQEATEGDEGGS